MPQYTHLFCKYSIKHKIEAQNSDSLVRLADFQYSIKIINEEFQETVKRTYQKATIDDRQNIYEELLMICALTPTDDYNSFTHTDVIKTFEQLKQKLKQRKIKKTYLDFLHQLSDSKRGSILKKRGNQRQYRFEFRNPILKMFIKLKAEEKNISLETT
ncbi:MAG: hypothetical protein MK033_12740 [Candidatus Caenarcaniphilales bacterium]|nr:MULTISPECIES: hypothetical protein [Crocosphaera]MCH2228631.1 hypothetical protein [Candidatus Caenarcaniphilales bacterium]NQZ60811.1 hypothetical protein [Crocosphaera sp.]